MQGPRPNSRRPSPLVGREPELKRLRERLNAAGRGEGGLVLIAGEPGIGKSRLLAELGAEARDAGWLVLTGAAYETEGMPPYLPFAEALRRYLRSLQDHHLDTLLATAPPQLALLMPELAERRQWPHANATAVASERYQLFERTSDFLLDLASDETAAGLLLFLDDLHWAEASSLQLLQHLARRIRGRRLLVAGAYRTEEVEMTRPFFTFLADAVRERLADRVEVGPLGIAEVAELLRAWCVAAEPALVDAVYRQTQGNPFYVEEVLHHIEADGASEAAWESELAVPEGVRQVVGKRILRLKPETQRLLQAGAVLGDGFLVEIAAAMSGMEDQVAMDALDQALAAGILRERGETCHFRHPLIQRTIYDGLSAARRRALHLRAARTIEETYGRYEPYLAQVAVNYRFAGARADPEKAVEYSVRAGTRAAKSLAYEDAYAHWQAALAIMERYDFEPARQAALLAQLGDMLQDFGFDRYAEAAESFKRAIELYDGAGEVAAAAAVRARLGLLLGAAGPVNDNAAALRYLHEAQRVLPETEDKEAQLWLYSGLGLVASFQIRPLEGLTASRKAMDLALETGRLDRWCTNAVMCGYHLHNLGRLEEGFHLLERAWEKADEIDQTYPAFVAASWLGSRLIDLCDPMAARAWFEREAGQKRQAPAPARLRTLLGSAMTARAMAGDLAPLAGGDPQARRGVEPEASFWLGEWEGLATALTRSRRDAFARESHSAYARLTTLHARLLHVQGDLAASAALFREALEITRKGPHAIFHLRAATGLAFVLCEQGEVETAREHIRPCRERLAQGDDWRGLAGRVALAEAVVAAADGGPDRATSHFEGAIEVFRRYTLPWDEAEALRLWGSALLKARRRAAALEKLDAAFDILRRHGAGKPWVERLETERRRAPTSSVVAAPAYPDGLTQREVEVLRLIAGGRSSRQIATDLVLSVRTVGRHVTNIYTKIGAQNRAEATAYALKQDLL